MASTYDINQAMKNITLDEEEESGIDIGETEGGNGSGEMQGVDVRFCLVGRFINEGLVMSMQHTLALLWRPGKGGWVKNIDVNLYVFQFYHELDIKRVIIGSPWTFNRQVLLIARMHIEEAPREVRLNKVDLWVQVYDMRYGFM